MVKTAAQGSKLRKRFQVLALSHPSSGQKTIDLVEFRIWLARCCAVIPVPSIAFEALRSRLPDVQPCAPPVQPVVNSRLRMESRLFAQEDVPMSQSGFQWIARSRCRPAARCVTVIALLGTIWLANSPRAAAQSGVQGQWQTLPNQMPINPVHAALLHNG